jgi:hypothetical protein
MARSGSYNFSLDRDTIIKRAMQLVNIININQTSRGAEYKYAVDIFQSMIKLWQAEGIQLWNRKQATLFPAYQDQIYSISNTGDHCVNSYIDTTLSADEASGQTVLSVTSSTGMTTSDIIGIELDNGTRQWTTILTVDSSTQITVNTALTSAAASGNTIITYTNKISDRPLRILDARTVDISQQNSTINMEMIGYDQYFNIPIKETDGRPLNFYYDKLLDAGVLYLYPRPDDVNVLVEFTYHESLEDVDSGTNNVDFPTEWTLPLIYGLAAELCVTFGKFEELKIIKPLADEYKKIVREFDNDEEPFFLLPDMTVYEHC